MGRASGASVIWGSGWLTVQSYTHLHTYPCSIYGLKRTTSAHRSAVGGLSSRCFRARASHVFSSYPGTATQMDIMWKMKRERAREQQIRQTARDTQSDREKRDNVWNWQPHFSLSRPLAFFVCVFLTRCISSNTPTLSQLFHNPLVPPCLPSL